MEGGFDVTDTGIDVEERLSIVVLPGWSEISLPNTNLPDQVRNNVLFSVCIYLMPVGRHCTHLVFCRQRE